MHSINPLKFRTFMRLLRQVLKDQENLKMGKLTVNGRRLLEQDLTKLRGQVASYFANNPDAEDEAVAGKALEIWLEGK